MSRSPPLPHSPTPLLPHSPTPLLPSKACQSSKAIAKLHYQNYQIFSLFRLLTFHLKTFG
ncbi:MAG: hypothetical protein SWX82_08320 [Cyanobacteriota bacterium]|nr:hypothetical protein [Cyanobacteriota bacterium]